MYSKRMNCKTLLQSCGSSDERLIGYKVGCTSAAIQALKISHRVRGFLFDTEQYESGLALATEF